MTPPALELKNAVKRYGRRKAMDGLDLCVPRGSAFGLVGSNGAGKTTTLSAVMGFLRLNAGSLRVLGETEYNPATSAGRVSFMPQDSALPAYARVADLLVFYARLQGVSRADARTDVRRVLNELHLDDRAGAAIRTLSHGMRRRVVVAQALLGNPELILLDEPLSGLDPREVVHLRKLLVALKGERTLVLSSHNLYEIELICDHVAFLENGRCVRQDQMADLTGRRCAITYRLASSDPVPVARLRATFPALAFRAARETLHCAYDASGHTASQINALLLPWLFEAGVGVNEVHQGAPLEEVYLQTGAPPEGQP